LTSDGFRIVSDTLVDNELVFKFNLLKSQLGEMASHFTCQQPTTSFTQVKDQSTASDIFIFGGETT